MSAGKQFAQTAARILPKLATAGGLVFGTSFVVDQCIYNVDAGEAVVLFDKLRNGVQDKPRLEGTHFKLPYFHVPYNYSIRSKPRVINTSTPTKDMQTISIALRVLSRPKTEALATVHRDLGLNWDDRVLPSIVNEVLKAVVAQHDADQLITMREQVSKQINQHLNARANSFNIMLDDVAITHLSFGHDFTTSVEAKQVAQQESERAKFIVDKNEQEKKAKVILAEGDALAAELISDSIKKNGKGFVEVQRIDAALEIANSLSNSRGVVYLPTGDGSISMLMSAGQ